jgi:hypothetical protein
MRCPDCGRRAQPVIYVACLHAFCHACARGHAECPACHDPTSVMATHPRPLR